MNKINPKITSIPRGNDAILSFLKLYIAAHKYNNP